VILRTFRIVLGFVLAWLASGIAIVLFVYTPAELASDVLGAPADVGLERLSSAGILSLAAATHHAVFSTVFALIAVLFAEWRGIGSAIYYALAGIVIALIGFLAQYASESGDPGIVNAYALTAFIVTGLVGGLIYWLFSGRHARRHPEAKAPSDAEKAAPSSLVAAPPPKTEPQQT
jgi:hypothetical protein